MTTTTTAVQTQPALFASANLPNTTYVLIMIDPDVRFNGSEVTILHWLAQDLILAPGNALHPYTLVSANASNMIAPYIGPAPPAELPPRAHKYVQLLYAQPENFNIPSSYSKVMLSRVGFALDGFVKEAGLKELVAGSWFEVRNDSLVAGGNGTAGPVQTGDAVGGNVARDGILGTGLLVAMMCFLGL